MAPRKKRYAHLLQGEDGRFLKRTATGAHRDMGRESNLLRMEAAELTAVDRADMKRNYIANKRFKEKSNKAIRLQRRNLQHQFDRLVREAAKVDVVGDALSRLEILTSSRGVDRFVFLNLTSEWLYSAEDQCASLELFETSDGRGVGVRTTETIEQGAYIIEYVGVLVSEDESYAEEDRSYMFELRGVAAYNGGRCKVFIDPRLAGNWARFINHHCDANCCSYSVADGTQRRVAIFAYKNIAAGEELTYMYSNNLDYFRVHFKCACGSSECVSKKL